MKELRVTMFSGVKFTKPKEQTTLEKVLMDIKSDRWKERIDRCRTDLKYKDWLPCFTPTGSFTHRSIKGLEEYNGIICLDVDHVKDPENLKAAASKLTWVHAAFITPSGEGLKVMVRTDSISESYTATEEKVASMFRDETNFSRDNHCKDIARIQFISYDPNLYYNPDSDIIRRVDTYSLMCDYYKKSFTSLESLLDDVIVSGMDPNYEIFINGAPSGENVINYINA